MYRVMLFVLALSATLGVSVGSGRAESSLRDILGDRFVRSRIEVENPSGEGRVIKKGTILLLQVDQIPAAKLRVVQANTVRAHPKSPRFHLPHYARVEVSRDGQLIAAPGELSLSKGTRLAVLDLNVSGDRVHLFTHTLDPVRLADGTAAYGCTEFVFAFDPATLARADVATVSARIDQWLSIASAS